MPKFERWNSPWVRSWPFAVFKRHHTELNNLYWASNISVHTCERAVRMSGKLDDEKISVALSIRADAAKRMDFSIEEWKTHVSDCANWTRLASLMSLASYFETFLGASAQLALLSNPGVMLKSSRAIDGIALLKSLTKQDEQIHIQHIRDQVSGITKGEWPNRMAAFERFFGAVPKELSEAVSTLDEIRRMRNGVGHTFGRNIDEYEDPLTFIPRATQRLSEVRLQKWLGVVEKAAVRIDQQLRGHIGCFEVLWMYHRAEKNIVGHLSEAQSLRLRFPDAQGNPPNKYYFEEAIKYYKQV